MTTAEDPTPEDPTDPTPEDPTGLMPAGLIEAIEDLPALVAKLVDARQEATNEIRGATQAWEALIRMGAGQREDNAQALLAPVAQALDVLATLATRAAAQCRGQQAGPPQIGLHPIALRLKAIRGVRRVLRTPR